MCRLPATGAWAEGWVVSDAFDVVIAGAGPAGSASAILLARRGLRVALLERSAFEVPRVGESLAPSVQPLLRELGVWDAFTRVPQLPAFGGSSVWGDAEPRAHSYLTSRFGCGFHVDRAAFDAMLAEAARAAGAELRSSTKLERCERERDGFRVTTRCGERRAALRARVLVDATGRSAHVARQLGAGCVAFDRAVAVAARWREPSESHLLVEACAPGWFYSAPLSGRALSVMWMTDADICAGLPLSAALELAPWTRERVAGAPMCSEARVYRAHSQRLLHAPQQLRAAGPYLAVGDAALAVDPIAGDGVVRALRSAAAADTCIRELLDAPDREAELLCAYAAASDEACSRYLFDRVSYYAAEQRFDSPYWRRRTRAAAAQIETHRLLE
jgi:flavin-dependent dehydrogenase